MRRPSTAELIRRLSVLLGTEVRALRPHETRGYTVAFHALAELADGRTAFVKAATEEVTAEFIRDEQRFFRLVRAPFMPALLAMEADDPPLLVLEDLTGAHWPPPWDEADIASVRETLTAVAATAPPKGLQRIEDRRALLADGWAEVEAGTEPFLGLGVCSAEWLRSALPVLREAAESAPIEGDALIHMDVRSDNLCLTPRGAVLVDWNHASIGNPDLDVAAWLPSLCVEGGPQPETILPGAPGFAALLAGFFASRAGLPPPPTAPYVREVQLAQLRVALPWAARELGLPPPG